MSSHGGACAVSNVYSVKRFSWLEVPAEGSSHMAAGNDLCRHPGRVFTARVPLATPLAPTAESVVTRVNNAWPESAPLGLRCLSAFVARTCAAAAGNVRLSRRSRAPRARGVLRDLSLAKRPNSMTLDSLGRQELTKRSGKGEREGLS
jgi:hypothetical protein